MDMLPAQRPGGHGLDPQHGSVSASHGLDPHHESVPAQETASTVSVQFQTFDENEPK
ncbi:hypothetical protein DPMN_017512 [Dreissena polymorpha]|uniref:Uncharacterized protein n=1 Tax=Dreissena polymorpha TaxID=45954 RepID=A0A9D4NFC4_DREPO|nr:hypothetical protein DPMN_017512 [Dreissena polymorpha]